MRRRGIVAIFSFLAVLALASNSAALTKGFEASSFHPAVDDGPYFTIYGTPTLKQWQWVVGTEGNFSYHPLRMMVNGVNVQGVVDDLIVQDVFFSAGLVDRWLQFGIDVPVAWWDKWHDPTVVGAPGQNKMAMGDVQINLKSEFVSLADHRVGFGLLPFITLPSGSGKYFNGAGNVTGGGKLLLEFLPFDCWHIALNTGILARQKYVLFDKEVFHQLLYGLGTAVDLGKGVSFAAEVNGSARLTGLFQEKVESPLEGDAGLKYAIGDSGVTVNAGGGAGFIRGSGAPSFRVFTGVAYKSKLKEKKEAPATAAVLPLSDVNNAKVHFKFNKTEYVSAQDTETVKHVADVLKDNPKAKVTIVGYTDSTGRERYNLKLSKRRAEKVKTDLVADGIAADRLSVQGKDALDPVATNKTKEGRAANRRAEFRVAEFKVTE